MKAGDIIADYLGDFYTVVHGFTCNECDKHGTCHNDPILLRECGEKDFIFKHVKTSGAIPMELAKASIYQLLDELKIRGFKGEITREKTVTEKHTL